MSSEKEKYIWDAFISHASEDKEEVVLPLATALTKKKLKIWIDKQEILLGDSLRRKIDEGLAKSRFGIVILSKSFFEKEWTKKELDALVSREDGQEKIILPIWHNITKSFISYHSPLLSDKLATSTEKGIEAVADEILRAIQKDLIEKGFFFSSQEVSSLTEAIKYFRARKGSFNTSDNPLLLILEKLNTERDGINIKRFELTELHKLSEVIDENIKYLNTYEYFGLTTEKALDNKQMILIPLFELRRKVMEEISLVNVKNNFLD